MAVVTFIQRSRMGRSIFTLRADVLEVQADTLSGKQSSSFPLRTISPKYILTAERVYLLIIPHLILAGFSAWCGNRLLSWPSDSPRDGLLLYAFLGFFGFGWMALRGIPRVERFVFFDHGGRELFHVVREKRQAIECEAFINELLDRVEIPRQGVHPDDLRQQATRRESAVRVPGSESRPVLHPTGNRWKISLVAGALSAGFQPMVEKWVLLHDWILPVVLLSSICGLCFGVLSWIAKERLRAVALLGMALALIAPIFY